MRKKITWKPDVKRSDPLPRPHNTDEKFLPATEEMLQSGRLYVGAMCQLSHHLLIEKADPKYIAPPCPVTFRTRWKDGGNLLKGSIAIYAGTVRDEMSGKAGIIHTLQHTFVVGGCRYIINPNNVCLVD